MIYELRTYSFHQGKMPAYLKLGAEVGRPVRGDHYGICHGYWTAEFGTLNQVWHLWSYDSLDERTRLRGELAKNPRWTNEYVAAVRPLLARQDIRLLNPIYGFTPPTQAGGVYELRMYRTVVGGAAPWATAFRAIMPVREKYSKNVGIWTGEAPQPNEVVHMWNYADVNARFAARAACARDPEWQAFIGANGHYLAEMTSTLLLPTAYSPAQ